MITRGRRVFRVKFLAADPFLERSVKPRRTIDTAALMKLRPQQTPMPQRYFTSIIIGHHMLG